MTNIFKDPRKKEIQRRLKKIALETLRKRGWAIERTPGGASMRIIRKGNETYRVSIRTTQDQWIAFPREADGTAWGTLKDADIVVVSSVDDIDHPQAARIHWIKAEELRERFDRALEARRKARQKIPTKRGIWIPLYIIEDGKLRHVGGGVGIDHPEIARATLDDVHHAEPIAPVVNGDRADTLDDRLTIAEAKRRLALTLGVSEASIKITIEA